MKIEKLEKRMFESDIKYLHYQTGSERTNLVIFMHGIGERSIEIPNIVQALERNNGWPKFAMGTRPGESTSRGSVNYPFDILAPQIHQDYKEIIHSVVPWAQLQFGYKNIILVGISMGGFAAWDILKQYLGRHVVRAIVNVCGGASLNEIQYMLKIPGIVFHGDMDDSPAKYPAHKLFVEEYNKAGGKIEFVTLPGVKHNAWDHAFNVDPTKDRALAFVNKIFDACKPVAAAPTVVVDPKVEFNKGVDAAIAAATAVKK